MQNTHYNQTKHFHSITYVFQVFNARFIVSMLENACIFILELKHIF